MSGCMCKCVVESKGDQRGRETRTQRKIDESECKRFSAQDKETEQTARNECVSRETAGLK